MKTLKLSSIIFLSVALGFSISWLIPVRRTITNIVTVNVSGPTISIVTEQEKCKSAGGTFSIRPLFIDDKWDWYNEDYGNARYIDSRLPDESEISCTLPTPDPLFDYTIDN